MRIQFDSKPVYGDNDKYIKAKVVVMWIQVFKAKNGKRKSFMQVFINNNARFCCQRKKKFFPHTFLEAWKYEPKKIKMESHINNELEKCSSDESDNDSNDEKEFDDKKDNDESNE